MTDLFTPIPFALWQSDKDAFAAAIGNSFRETGFAVIDGHPIATDLIQATLETAQDFFALPPDAKQAYYDKEAGGQRGYTPFGTENAKGAANHDLKEFWHTGRALDPNGPYQDKMLPTPHVAEVENFDETTYKVFTALDMFGRELLRGIACHLKLEETWFEDKVNHGNSILRLLHYPAQQTPPPAGTVRAGAHEDINVITLLLGADEAGLEVLHRSGKWLPVNPPPSAIVINCGDMLQRMTGGVLPSTTHRVVNPSPERAKFSRYSMPYFLHFNPDVLIKALPGCLDEGGKAEPPITATDYLMERLIEIGLVKA
ncbi:MAG: 2-oxoglutarate and iron-dependent oxygenase domain-containing protein [Pseudomonadota bacterium]